MAVAGTDQGVGNLVQDRVANGGLAVSLREVDRQFDDARVEAAQTHVGLAAIEAKGPATQEMGGHQPPGQCLDLDKTRGAGPLALDKNDLLMMRSPLLNRARTKRAGRGRRHAERTDSSSSYDASPMDWHTLRATALSTQGLASCSARSMFRASALFPRCGQASTEPGPRHTGWRIQNSKDAGTHKSGTAQMKTGPCAGLSLIWGGKFISCRLFALLAGSVRSGIAPADVPGWLRFHRQSHSSRTR